MPKSSILFDKQQFFFKELTNKIPLQTKKDLRKKGLFAKKLSHIITYKAYFYISLTKLLVFAIQYTHRQSIDSKRFSKFSIFIYIYFDNLSIITL